MPGILLTKDEQEQVTKEFGNTYVSPTTISKSMPLTGAETNEVLNEFSIKPDTNAYIPPQIQSMGANIAADLQKSSMIADLTTPDQAVKDIQLSNEMDVPVEYFMTDADIREQVAQAAKDKKNFTMDWGIITKQYPTLSRFLSDPKNMATAKDLLPELAEHEAHFKKHSGATGTWNNSYLDVIANGIKSGMWQFEQGATGIARLPMEVLFGKNNSMVKALSEHVKTSTDIVNTADAKKEAYSPAQQFLYTGLSGVTNMAPSLALGGVLGASVKGGSFLTNALSKIVQALPFGMVSGGQYAEEAKAEGAGLGQQSLYGAIGGTVETLLSVPFISGYLKTIGAQTIVRTGAKNIMKEFGRVGYEFLLNSVKEIGEEVATSPIMSTAKKMIYDQEIPWTGQGGVFDLNQAFGDAYGAIAMTTLMHAMGLPFSSRAHKMAKAIIETGKTPTEKQVMQLRTITQVETPHSESKAAIEQSKTNVEVYKKTGDLAAQSQYLDRLPENWRTLAEMNLKDGQLENIYIDAEPLVTLLQSMAPEGTDPGMVIQEVAKELGISTQLQEAIDTGKAVKIPYATWLEKVAKTPIYKQMEKDIKFSEEGLTLNQAAVEEERVKTAIEEEQKQAQIQETNYDFIYNDIKDQLIAAGRTKAESEYAAKIWTARAVTEGARRNINPLEWYMGQNKPEILKVDFMPKDISPAIIAQLNDNEKIFIESLTDKNQSIEQIQRGLEDKYNKILNDQINYLNESGKKGVQQGSLVYNDQGKVIDMVGRQSKNVKWYRDFYAKKGRAPSQKEIRELAAKQLREGYVDDTAEIPANQEFVQLENTINGVNGLKDKVSRLMGKGTQSLNQLSAGDSKHLMDILSTNLKPTPPMSEKSSTFIKAIIKTLESKGQSFNQSIYDIPEIVAAQKMQQDYLDKNGPTININTSERLALREQIAEELYGEGAKNKDRKSTIVLGLPASGKSKTIAEPLAKETGSLIIDSDIAKEQLPEFDNGKLAGALHAESDLIWSKILNRALKNNDNIVLPLVGKDIKKIRAIRDTLLALGYTVDLKYVDVPVKEAINRAITRFFEKGRFVDPAYVARVGLQPRENYDIMKSEKEWNSYEAYSNDVIKGEDPRLLESSLAGRKQAIGSWDRSHEQNTDGTGNTNSTNQKIDSNRSGNQGDSYFQTNAWHGSPHDFDKFMLDHIGTGEGNQSYGWGLYFAGSKEIAEFYKEALSNVEYFVDDKKLQGSDAWAAQFLFDPETNKRHTTEEAVDDAKSTIRMDTDEAKQILLDVIDKIHSFDGKDIQLKNGNLYEVSLTPNEEDFLNWDKPIAEEQINKIYSYIDRERDPKFAAKFQDYFYRQQEKGTPIDGMDVYTELSKYFGSDKAASLILNTAGIPGIKYLDASGRGKGEGSHNYVIFDDKAVNLINKFNQDARANVNILPDKSIVTLFSNADKSSFLHESSHIWLNDSFEYVKSGQADEKYLVDWKTLSDWLGIKDDQEKLTVEQQEQFARGFESYLMEGKSPSEGLKKAFAAFRKWLVRIYREAAGLNVELSNEVRGVMDRMLATEEEIAEREAVNGYLTDVIKEKDVSPGTWKKLQSLKEQAHEMAIETLLKPQMDELKPEHADFLANERERMQPIVAEEVAKLPIYQVMEAVKQTFGMQKDVKDLAGRYMANDGITDDGIARFEAIADAFGYSSGDHLAKSITKAPLFSDEVNNRLDVHMSQYGDLNNSMEIKYEAEKAVHNDIQLEVLALEHSIFLDLVHQEEQKQNKIQWNREQRRIAEQAAKKYARVTLADKPYREAMAATSYFAAERDAAIKWANVYTRGDVFKAAQFSEQRLLNHALALEAMRIKEEVDKDLKYLDKFTKKKRPEIIQEFMNQIDKILGRFKVAEPSPNAKQDETTLAEWIKSREAYDDAVIPAFIANEYIQKDYKELTLSQLRDLVNAVKNIETVARNEKKQLTDEKKRDFDAITKEITNVIRGNNKVLFPEDLDPNAPDFAVPKRFLRNFIASHQKVEWIVRALDGYRDQGSVWRYVVLPFMRAMDKEYKLRREAGEKYSGILQSHYGKDTSALATKKIHIEAVSHIFSRGLTKENILAMALNWGNEVNKKRLIDSYLKTEELTKEDVYEIIVAYRESHSKEENDKISNGEIIYNEKAGRIRAKLSSVFDQQMTKNDWDFVQDVWNMVNSYWPLITEVQKARTGVEPLKVEASPVNTPYGEYAGGYFHIDYDPTKSEIASRQSEQESLKGLTEITYMTPSTSTGFTKERGEAVHDRPLNLHLSSIDKHLTDVIHMVSFINALRDVDRILNNKEITSAIKETQGDEVYKQFRPWLMGIGYEYRNPMSAPEKILNHARVGSSIVNMGFKFTTAFSQYAGLPSIMEKIGKWRTITGVLDFHAKMITGKAGEEAKFVFDKSEMMKNRMRDRDRDIKDVTKKLVSQGKYDQIKETYFALVGLFDFAITIPSWTQAYNKHIEDQVKTGEQINEEMAIRYADGVIRETQGSGDIVNMAQIQRGSEMQKLLTQFYSYFSVFANKEIEAVQRAKRKGEYAQLASFAIYWWFIPAVMSELLSGRGPSGDDPDELKWVKWVLTTTLKYPFSAFIILRDVVNAMGGKFGGYEMTPTSEALNKGVQLWNVTVQKAIEGKEVDWGKAAKIGFEAGGYWLHYPARQMSITVGNIFDEMVNGEDFHLRDLFFPKPK